MATTLYDRRGKPVAYVADDGISIYLYRGKPVAWISQNGVYAYSGKFLGWVDSGWVIDRRGRRAFFTSAARGGPVKPVRQLQPVRGVRRVRPVRGVRQVRPVRPVTSLSWSDVSGEEFFGS
jgi:hypothetical protein